MMTVCTACMAMNRLPEENIMLHNSAKCGRCSYMLFDGQVINATMATLDKLLRDDLPTVIDFWANWCGPCGSFAPIFATVAKERVGKIRLMKVDTEAEQSLNVRFAIRSIPTILFYRNGSEVGRLRGARSKASFDSWLDEQLVL